MFKIIKLSTTKPQQVSQCPSARILYVLVVCVFLLCFCCQLDAQVRVHSNGKAISKALIGEIVKLGRIHPTKHIAVGWLVEELGDLNQDGYDDYAVSSYLDTTWIYYGGDPIPTESEQYVLGGGNAIEAADVNGDGAIDIITASNGRSREDPDLFPGRRGNIRVFLNTGVYPFYSTVPDQEIKGDSASGMQMFGWAESAPIYEGVKAVDADGDGKTDLLFVMYDVDSTSVRFGLLMGGYPFSGRPDTYLHYPRRDYVDRSVDSRQFLVGDLNGDGMTDMVVNHVWKPSATGTAITGWEIFLGNSNGQFLSPDYVMGLDGRWTMNDFTPVIRDLNNDGYDDIVDGIESVAYEQPKVWYGSDVIDDITPVDSLEMPDRDILENLRAASAVGDMNGDGTDDLIVGWIPKYARNGTAFHFYPSRSDHLHLLPYGTFGIDQTVVPVSAAWTFPVGDVNGDGYEDIAVLGRSTWTEYPGQDNGFVLYGGTAHLVNVKTTVDIPNQYHISVYPNPSSSRFGELSVKIESSGTTDGEILIYDMTGREYYSNIVVLHEGSQTVCISDRVLPVGVYLIVLTTKQGDISTTFIQM